VNSEPSKRKSPAILPAIDRIVDTRFGGMRRSLSDALSCSKGSVTEWMNGGVPIKVERLIQISYICRIPLQGIIDNSFKSSACLPLRALDPVVRQTQRRRKTLDTEHVKAVLASVADGSRTDVTTYAELQEATGVRGSTLRRNFSVEYSAAIAKIRAARAAKRQMIVAGREAAFDEVLLDAVEYLRSRNARLSRRAIEQAMKDRGQRVHRDNGIRIDLLLRRTRVSGNSGCSRNPA
jgi:hypothetical protein